MKKNFRILYVLFFSSLFFASCQDNKPKNGGELVQQAAILYNYVGSAYNQANAFNVNAIDVEETDIDPVIKNFRVEFVKPVEEETEVFVSVSDEAAKEYLKTTGMKYEILPKDLVTLPKSIKVKKGEMKTPELSLSVNINSNKIKLNTQYIFALRLDRTSENGDCNKINIFNSNNTIVYSLIRREKTVDITRVTSINRDVFFQPSKYFPASLPNGMTMECLINVSKFRGAAGDTGDAGISTLMGIEGRCLLRFGDAGVEPNVLQACGQKVPFKFSTNRWYHIAAVFTRYDQLIIYIDGNKIAEYTNSQPILYGQWYIARSYNGNRGIVAKFSEVRIWSTARTQSEIQNNMYGVDPKSTDLMAYWKMDKAEASNIADVTGNGYDLVQKTQDKKTPKDVEIVTLPSPLEIE